MWVHFILMNFTILGVWVAFSVTSARRGLTIVNLV